MEIKASLNRYRQSPRKVRLVARLVSGKKVALALSALAFIGKRAGEPIAKLIRSAVANAEHNHKLHKENLEIKSITVDEGPTMKRSMPRAFGRGARIKKRTSRINLILKAKS
jgi:large subunit ribosomal protein L22